MGDYQKRSSRNWMARINWIHLAQDKDLWWAFVNMIMKLRIPQYAGNFLTGWADNCRLLKKDLINQLYLITVRVNFHKGFRNLNAGARQKRKSPGIVTNARWIMSPDNKCSLKSESFTKGPSRGRMTVLRLTAVAWLHAIQDPLPARLLFYA
jgi:hypothetical protein